MPKSNRYRKGTLNLVVQYFVQVLRRKSSKSTTFETVAKRGDEEQYTANIWIIT